jgi:hypothetical protein
MIVRDKRSHVHWATYKHIRKHTYVLVGSPVHTYVNTVGLLQKTNSATQYVTPVKLPYKGFILLYLELLFTQHSLPFKYCKKIVNEKL